MLIDPDEIVCYILNLGIMDVSALIEGRFRLTSIYRRNRNFRIESDNDYGYIIKQPSLDDSNSRSTLLAEANFYQFCQSKEELSKFSASLPYLERNDPQHSMLILNWIENSKTLWEVYHSSYKQFPFQVVRDLGSILGTGHLGSLVVKVIT